MRICEPNGRSRVLALCLLALTGPLAGCSSVDRAVATSPVPDDFHLRHPVVLANARRSLDIFLDGHSDRLDERQKRDVQFFAADYKTNGQGRIQALLPRGAVDSRAVEATLASVRRVLVQSGVQGEMEVGSYPAGNPKLASTVHLSFLKLQAKLASRCGEWPDDLASAGTLNGWDNRTYYNFGCSTQQTLASQVEDPRDLVRPRVEDPGDVVMRTRAIGNIRTGVDPGTNWSITNDSITTIGPLQ